MPSLALQSTRFTDTDPDIVVFTETHFDPQAPMKKKHDGMAAYQTFRNSYKVGCYKTALYRDTLNHLQSSTST